MFGWLKGQTPLHKAAKEGNISELYVQVQVGQGFWAPAWRCPHAVHAPKPPGSPFTGRPCITPAEACCQDQ